MLIRYLLAFVLSVGLASAAMAAGSTSSSKPSKLDVAEKAVKAGNYNRAIELLQKVVAGDSQNADAWNYLGFSQRKLKKFDQALGAYRKALAIDPEHRGANEYLGELYLRTGNLAKAKERLKKLDDVCTFGCEEFDDLKQAIKAYEANNKG
ncbi:MAG: tetratricopeptide repeat protein [Proteobacteria bacterium]|nr:tetratricopeptide repeat protein [Pseudomonadota bacterium]